jgi:hypothetical protein
MAESVKDWFGSVIGLPASLADTLSGALGVPDKHADPSKPAASTATKDPKKDEKKAPPISAAEQTKDIEKEISSGPWAKLSESLVKQYQEDLSPVTAAVSGATNATGQADAASQALGSLGLSPNSSAGQWFESQLGAANANAAGVTQAMNQYGAQYAAEAGPITKALQAYGQANELEVSTAPEQSWLNALASHITSNLSYYGEVPESAIGSIPSGVATALQQSGGYPGSTSSGLVPLSSLGTNAAGQTVAKSSASNALESTNIGGSVPTDSNSSAGSG